MSIKRILLLTSMALAVIAYAAPAVAQANVFLTDPNGTKLPSNKNIGITATSTDLLTTLEGGNKIECEKVTLHLKLLTNGNTHVTLEQLGEATVTNCKFNAHATLGVTFPTTVTDGTVGVGENKIITINTWGTAKTQTTILSHSYSGAHEPPNLIAVCHPTGPMHFQANANNTDVLNVTPSVLTRTQGEDATCPSSSATFEGSFTLETSGVAGAPVTIDFKQT